MRSPRGTAGYSMVELLVVMLILGVLAAVAVPMFTSQKAKAYRAAVTSDAKSLMTAQATRLVDDGYTEDLDQLKSAGFTRSGGVQAPVIKVVGSSYTACVKHEALDEWLVLDGTAQSTSWADDGSACA